MAELSPSLQALLHGELGDLEPRAYSALARELAELPEAELPIRRLAFVASYSIEFAAPYLAVEGARAGARVACWFGPFGQLEQPLADAQGELYAFDPAALVIAVRPEDLVPDVMVRFHASAGARFGDVVDSLLTRIEHCIALFREHSSAPILVANFALPASLPLRVFDAGVADSLTHAIAEANRRVAETLARHPDCFVWDYAGLVRERGAAGWTDPRLQALARAPVAAVHQPALARHVVRTLRGALEPPAKCLVLDLDNTLWGGVIGDDGIEGIQLSDDHPGSAYKAFQRVVLGLRDRGILLAVVSKNDPPPVERVFREHPEMLIAWDDLAAVRINWDAKSGNLRAIADDLNLGADSLVFFDDNPVERAEVRANAPEVRVVEVPKSPLEYAAALEACSDFDAAAITREDTARAEIYRQERRRRDLRGRVESVDDFLAGLEMQVDVGELGPESLQRIAQLVGKTNQFNLTTRRHGRAELEQLAADPQVRVCWMRLADRYGDSGLVAVAILVVEGACARIDTLLMSCRVMGRGVERAVVAHLIEQARAEGCEELIGDYLPTAKNGLVASLYPDLGFAAEAELPEGGKRFSLDLRDCDVSWPDWIDRASESQ